MFHTSCRAAALALALLPALAAATPLTLDEALELAVQRSATTRAARAVVSSATEAARASSQLPDPTLRVGVDNLPVTGADRYSSARDSMTMKRIGIGQEWLSAQKRAARSAAADAMVARESAAVQGVAAEVRLQTAMAYLDALYAGETLKLAVLAEHHLHEELETAKARLASSTGSTQDVLALTSAQGVAEDDSAELRQAQAAARVALEKWVGEKWVGVAMDDLVPPKVTAPPTEPAYVAAHPGVTAAQRETELARQEASVASANRNPNWTWELSYGQRSGYSDMLSLGVSIPLPVAQGQRQDRDTAAKLAMVDKAEADLAEATRAATAEYRATLSDAQRLAERIERYRSAVVASSQQRSAAAMAGYRSNQVSLSALFEARHMELSAQRKLLVLQRELAKAQAQLAYKPLAAGGLQ